MKFKIPNLSSKPSAGVEFFENTNLQNNILDTFSKIIFKLEEATEISKSFKNQL